MASLNLSRTASQCDCHVLTSSLRHRLRVLTTLEKPSEKPAGTGTIMA
jgi:hypothetical protein